MNIENQKSAPVYEALERFRRQRVVPFDVPGHKRGRGNPELVKLLGEQWDCCGRHPPSFGVRRDERQRKD